MPTQYNPAFVAPPNRDVKVWRYMTLSKFLWMLQQRALYFTRSDLLGDPYEGHYSRITALSEDSFVTAQMSEKLFAAMGEDTHRRNFKQILQSVNSNKRHLFVSCWHMNEFESMAMWRLYASNQDAICIQSTFSKLESQLADDIFLGVVKYINYETDYLDLMNGLEYITNKRSSFEHEREVRAVIWSPHSTKRAKIDDGGYSVPVDLNTLVESIYVNPNAERILAPCVENLAVTYGVTAPIRKSNLNSAPNY